MGQSYTKLGKKKAKFDVSSNGQRYSYLGQTSKRTEESTEHPVSDKKLNEATATTKPEASVASF